MTVSVSSNLGSVYTLNVALLVVTGLTWSSPVKPAVTRSKTLSTVDSPLLNTQDFLSQFLSTLNLTKLRPKARAHLGAREESPPEFMLQLYDRFANDRSTVPSANIVRSFKNEESSTSIVKAGGVRIHPLLFNITIPRHESITLAELHLFLLVREAQKPHADAEWKVTIYNKHDGPVWTKEVGKEVRGRDKDKVLMMEDLEELVTKCIRIRDNTWVSFDLTRAVGQWRKSGYTVPRLEVHVASLCTPFEDGRSSEDINIDRNLEGKHNVALIIFSDDHSREYQQDRQELKQIIEHENDLKTDVDNSRQPFRGGASHREHANKQLYTEPESNLISDTHSRVRRNVKSQSCRRTPLFVDFKDIGWDSWIIQPLGYEAYKCNGVCNLPMTSEVSPTNHAMAQTLLSLHSPEKTSRACCVPTKLEPISLLYRDNGVVTYNYKYEGMVVAECGCR